MLKPETPSGRTKFAVKCGPRLTWWTAKVWLGTRSGILYVFAAGREKQKLLELELGKPISATPVAGQRRDLYHHHVAALCRDLPLTPAPNLRKACA